jgi:UDP-N-acetyl-D-glucosamine dehydrogenase
LVWGVAYKKDINDPREGAAYDVIPNLMRKGASVDYFDSLIPEFRIPAGNFMLGNPEPIILKSVENGLEAVKNYDAVIILCDHSGFDYVELAKNASLVIDTRNAIKSREFANVYRF